MASDAADADIDAGASQREQPMRTSMHPSNAPRSLEPVEMEGWRATQPMRTSMRAPRRGSNRCGHRCTQNSDANVRLGCVRGTFEIRAPKADACKDYKLVTVESDCYMRSLCMLVRVGLLYAFAL